jgi:AAA+ ATPase superfamily predicted ATPase
MDDLDMNCIPVKNIDDLIVPDDKFGVSFLLVGSTRSGKTSLLNFIYNKYFKKHISVLMSNSLNSDAYDFVKQYAILSDMYHPEMITELYKINHGSNNHYKFCIILDDLTSVKNDKEYKRLLCVMRNQRISCVVSAQGISLFDKTARGNINIVCCGRMNSDAEKEKVIKEYLLSYFPKNLNMAEKITLYTKMTADHWFICIEQIEGSVFRTKLRPEQMLNE